MIVPIIYEVSDEKVELSMTVAENEKKEDTNSLVGCRVSFPDGWSASCESTGT